MSRAIRWAVFLILLSVPSLSQHLRLKTETEPPSVPVSKPEPRRRLQSDPVTIFQNVLSSSKTDRGRAYQDLGLGKDGPDEAPQPRDARLYAVNLDAGSDLEYVFAMSSWPVGSVAYVFAKDAEAWWEVGKFGYRWHWNSDQAERFIELREIVSYGRKDIIVREQNGGTGFAVTDLSIYRMHEGRLYRIFHTTEDAFHYVYGGGETVFEERKIEYPEPGPVGGKFLVVRYRGRTEPDKPDGKSRTRHTQSCSAYWWDAAHFVFVEQKSAAGKLCTGNGR
jgi:hypothetical protein